MHHFVSIAPTDITATGINGTAIRVSVVNPTNPVGIDHYEVRAEKKSTEEPKDGASMSCPISKESTTICDLGNLTSATEYDVVVSSCDKDNEVCSVEKRVTANTTLSCECLPPSNVVWF